MCLVAQGSGQRTMGYIIGKAEGQGENWHGHVTAVTVAPEFRRCDCISPEEKGDVCKITYSRTNSIVLLKENHIPASRLAQ